MVIMEEVYQVFDNAQQINVYNEGVKTVYNAGSAAYEKILSGWNELLQGSHQMPAFGVSLNRETVKAIAHGLWAEFCFEGEYECGGLPFEKLLVKVESESQGFNLIRYTTEYGYDGRCIYIDLVSKNMSSFYDILLNL